ncbi:uncharacterized protein LOC106069962 [Biomphalaria glabrata]|uniref:Uncharacterized protein LOC106069962 n=1 Tax=Biomphalaria glabrata TaxID=6526 RepID=A0A9U8EF68_BIOGL|nr:uncharacterized protein LOC106069962 [Biomphalaria glabrata]
MENKVLVVGLCIEDLNSCDLLVSQIASGHIFGLDQKVHLIIQGPSIQQVHDLCFDIQDCAYTLVQAITGCASLLDTNLRPDVVMIVVSAPCCHGNVTRDPPYPSAMDHLVSYINELTQLVTPSQWRQSHVIVTGDMAVIAANLLSQKLNNIVTATQIMAVDGDLAPDSLKQKSNKLSYIDRLCSRIRQWWTGSQSAAVTYLGSYFIDLKRSRPTRSGYFFSMPVEILAPRKFQVRGQSEFKGNYITDICRKSDAAQEIMRQLNMEPANKVEFYPANL